MDEKKELTWEDVYHDFRECHPNTASLVDDWRPYSAYMIQIWLKTGAHISYNYLTKNTQNLK